MEVCRTIWFEKYELDVLANAGCLSINAFGSRSEITGGMYRHMSNTDLISYSKKLKEYSSSLWKTGLDSKVGEADTALSISLKLSDLSRYW